MPAKQMSKREIKKIVDSAIRDSMPALEGVIDSVLAVKLRSMGMSESGNDMDDPTRKGTIRKLVKDAFDDMDHVRRAYWSDDGGKLRLVIIHDGGDRDGASSEARDRAIKLEDALPGVRIEPHVLHESEVEPSHTYYMITAFER